ncbi:sugar ABC transporter ATP-binding protein [Paracoccus sp. IB05]|uniref:sugar ABC transporter ATP-binding protein n=1 Tax=Paracoccus sp. IB05 TaxID=2779367 RepID=UPI0018E774F7|nr:sugar ABC transporter ATP-binding protein [Paracoccus sp. IB05]MBJ2153240.1 sugar ABC transporter ATP-binding protein [Paracoccus sp. IB05]
MDRSPVVSFQRIGKSFPGVRALSNVSLSLNPGEIHAVIGENGAGKSTLMNILAGVLAPSEGTLMLDGQPLRLASPLDARRRGIAVVFQELSLCRNLSVGENVMLPALAEIPSWQLIRRARAQAQSREILARLGMDIDPATPLRDLSVAQMQLVEIARALARKVRVLVLDEPNSALSPHESEHLFNIMRQLRAEGVAIVYISHHLNEVLALSDRISVMRDGELVESITDLTGIEVPHLVAAMVGRDLGDAAPYGITHPPRDTAPVLSLRDFRVPGEINGVSLDLRPGEILGIGGLPGSGKDILAEAIFGLCPRSGTVTIAGQTLPAQKPMAAIRAGIALIPADRRNGGALLSMSVAQNVVSSTLDRHSKIGVLRNDLIGETASQQIRAFDARVSGPGQVMSTLSGGNQQKIILSRGIVSEPKVLILHEPTRGIDVGAKAEIYAILKRLAGEGLAVLMISSELPELVLHANRVVMMAHGMVSRDFTGAEISEQNLMMAASVQPAHLSEVEGAA